MDDGSIEGLKYTPAAALGTCRYKIDFKKKPEAAAKDMDRLFQVFEAHNIRFFFYAGGNDSQDTSHKIHEEAVKRGYTMRVIPLKIRRFHPFHPTVGMPPYLAIAALVRRLSASTSLPRMLERE